jgi:hypothetical protein
MNIVTLEFFWPIGAHAQSFNEAMNDMIPESFCRSRHMRDFQTGPQL